MTSRPELFAPPSITQPVPESPQISGTICAGIFLGLGRPVASLLSLTLSLLFQGSAVAVIFVSTGDPTFNTTAPTGALQDSGWQYEGQWGSFLGTAISADCFVTAKHVGGNVGDSFVFGGVSYTTTASYASPSSDLQIWRVNGTFSTYASIYRSSDETGQGLVDIGRGTQRGAAIYNSDGALAGWGWGANDGVMRWGQNVVAAVQAGGAGIGDTLRVSFNNPGVANSATISSGDSGGGLFIQQGGTWKLAGINYAVEGPFSHIGSDPDAFNAALFDKGGLYAKASGIWVPITDQASDIPSAFLATRISANSAWIDSVTVPEPGEYAAFASLSLLAFGFARHSRAKLKIQ